MAKKSFTLMLAVITVSLTWASTLNVGLCVVPPAQTSNFESSYTFSIQNGYYLADHTLYLSIPPSAMAYYAGRSHTVNSEIDYVKFVTPSVVFSIAKNIRNLTSLTPYDDEEFANAVLMIVRDIPYLKSNPKYPVETLVDNHADCDGLSILAASIMKAGGLDVVLLLYNNLTPPHMNIGVCLKQMPVSHSWWAAPSGIAYNNKTYWVAECTSLAEWTVGDRPDLLVSAKPQIIPLTNCDKSYPAKVSSSMDGNLLPSSISINLATVYSNSSDNSRIVKVSGSLHPPSPEAYVTLYVHQPGYAPIAHVIKSDELGNYSISWNTTLPGTYIMRTSWSGSQRYSGSDSVEITIFIGAQQFTIEDLAADRRVIESQTSPWYMTLLNQGSKEFLRSSIAGSNAILSGDFMVLSDGHEITPNDTTITIPEHKETYRLPRSTRSVTVVIPEQVITIPGIELLSSQFGFILQQNAVANYTASVKLLTNDDLLKITQSNGGSEAAFFNASDVAKRNVWCKAVAKTTGEKVSIDVYTEGGTRLGGTSYSKANLNSGVFSILMTYPTGQIIAFKNLKIETLTQGILATTQSVSKPSDFEFWYPYARTSLLLAGAGLAVVSLKQRRDCKRRSDIAKQSTKTYPTAL